MPTSLQRKMASTRKKSLQMTTAQDFSKYQETRLEGSPHRRVGEVPGHQPWGPDTQNQDDQCKREGTVKVCAMPCLSRPTQASTTSYSNSSTPTVKLRRHTLTFFEAQHPAAKLHGWRSTPSLIRPGLFVRRPLVASWHGQPSPGNAGIGVCPRSLSLLLPRVKMRGGVQRASFTCPLKPPQSSADSPANE